MKTVQRILGAYALIVAVAVAVNFIITPLYDDGSTGYPVWSVFDWFIAPAVVLALVASLIWKRGVGDNDPPVQALGVNTLFYSSLVLALWFFPNWFGDLMVGRDVPLLWSFIDPLFVAVLGACGVRLWRSA